MLNFCKRPAPQPQPRTWITPAGSYSALLHDDILQQPHVLIAGTTGAGKSVLINSILYSALYSAPSAAHR